MGVGWTAMSYSFRADVITESIKAIAGCLGGYHSRTNGTVSVM